MKYYQQKQKYLILILLNGIGQYLGMQKIQVI